MRALAAAALLSACVSTSYLPQPSPGITITVKDGTAAFSKHGKVVQMGAFGKGLSAALADVPAAARHAEIWRQRNWMGIGLQIASLALTVTGFVLLQPSGGWSDRNFAALGLMGGGFGAGIGGLGVMLGGQSHLWDALNLYNDHVRKLRTCPGGVIVRW